MRQIELELLNQFPRFRRIWVDYSTYRGIRVCVTLFPSDYSRYRMVFGYVNELSLSSISSLIENNLKN